MNPYSTGSAFPNMAPTINNFVDNLVRLKTHQDDIDMRGRQLAEQTRQHDLMLPIHQGNLAVSQGNLAVQQAQEAKKPPLPDFQQVLNPAEVAAKKVSFKTAFGEGALKVLEPAFTTIDEIASANPTTTKWDAYAGAKEAWAGQRDDIIASADKYLMSPEFQKLKPAQQEAFTDLYNKIKYDKTGDIIYDGMLFKNTVASKQTYDSSQKAALLEAKYGFQNEILNQKFENYKEMQGLKFQNQKELQDAKYNFLKDLRIAGAGADAMGRKIMQGAYMEQLRDVDRELRGMNPLMYEDEASYRAARSAVEDRRKDILNDIRELSGLPTKQPAAATQTGQAHPLAGKPAGQYKDRKSGKVIKWDGSKEI